MSQMSEFSIYQFRDARDFVREVYEGKRRKNPGFSVRAWARQMDLPHHALLALAIAKKRKLKSPFSARIRDQIGLKGQEARYFDLLVAFNNAETLDEKQFYEGLLRQLAPSDQPFSELSFDILRLISQWIHTAIIEMTELEEFNSDPRWIASRLGESATPLEAQEAVDRLVRLRLLENSDGRLRKTQRHFTTPSDIPSHYIRDFHKQLIDKAKRSLDEQPVEEREVRALTLAIRKDRIPEAKQMLREFTKQFQQAFETKPGERAEEVYQLNLQLFGLTKTEKKKEYSNESN